MEISLTTGVEINGGTNQITNSNNKANQCSEINGKTSAITKITILSTTDANQCSATSSSNHRWLTTNSNQHTASGTTTTIMAQ